MRHKVDDDKLQASTCFCALCSLVEAEGGPEGQSPSDTMNSRFYPHTPTHIKRDWQASNSDYARLVFNM